METIQKEEKKVEAPETKVVLQKLTHSQRQILAEAFKDLGTLHPIYRDLGSLHKAIFIDTVRMLEGKHFPFMPITGVEFSRMVDVGNGKKKKEDYLKWVFTYIVPGSGHKIELEKEFKKEWWEEKR